MKALLYIRVSTNWQKNEGHSPDEQRDRLVKFAEGSGFEILEIIQDNGRSGRSTKSRPGFQRVMEIVKDRGCDAVVVNELSRFARSLKDVIHAAELMEKNGVDFISRKEKIDTTTPVGRVFFHIMAALAQFQSDQLSLRIKEAHAFAEKEGRKLGQVPRGYKRDKNKMLVEDEEEQQVIQLVRQLSRKKGLSYPKICDQLEEWQIPNKSGNVKWFPSQIQKMVN